MRQPREVTVKELSPLFLEGKSDEYKAAFEAKPLDKRYTTIMNWKRKNEKLTGEPVTVKTDSPAKDIIKQLRKIRKTIELGAEMNESEISKIGREMNVVRETLTNYARIRTARILEEMELERSKMDRRIEALRQSLGEEPENAEAPAEY